MSFLFKLSTIKLRHTKDGIEMVSSEATLSQIPTLNKYNFKTEISTTFEAFQSGKMSLDFNNDILNVDLDLDLEWNSLNKRGAKLTYEVASLSIYIVSIEKVFFRTMANVKRSTIVIYDFKVILTRKLLILRRT